jgi:predicted GNAT superfamily acetyltransferase
MARVGWGSHAAHMTRSLQRPDAAAREIVIRDAAGAELIAGGDLLAASLRFSERDAIPAWLMQTTVDCGGVALGAFRDGVLGGFSYALPCGDWELFSCGLAVAPEWRGLGIGRRLKLAQRDRARRDGRSRIRWTADPLSAHALGLYLAGLGARLTGYAEELYAAVRPSPVPADDVVIDWRVTRAAQAGGCPGRERAARHGQPDAEQQGLIRGRGPAAARVEVPFDHSVLGGRELLEWRLRVRRAMCGALESGAIGTGVAIDRAARRAWVLFEEPAR